MSILEEFGALAEDLTRYSRLCYERRLVGAAGGNLSVRVPGHDVFMVTAGGVALRDVSPTNLVVVDRSGKLLEGPAGANPSKESGFHLAVYTARPEVGAIIHVHPPCATSFAVRGSLIPAVTVSAQLKLKQGPIVPVANPGSKELADLVSRVVTAAEPEATVFLLKAHGLLTARPTLAEAFNDAELAEDTARIALFSEMPAATAISPFANTRLIDLTATLNERTPCYPTDPQFAKRWHAHFDKLGVYVSNLEMGAHTGTHVDAPLHFLGDAFPDVARLSPQLFMGEAVVLDRPKLPGQDLIASDIEGADIRRGDIVLFRTGWDQRAGTPAFFQDEWPGFHPALVEALIDRGVKAIGGDIASIDSPSGIANGAPAHKVAGRAGFPLFEALVNLDQLAGRRCFFIGLPLKLEGGEASPIRAVALV
jgi:L-fuculose-phosphate aldolase